MSWIKNLYVYNKFSKNIQVLQIVLASWETNIHLKKTLPEKLAHE